MRILKTALRLLLILFLILIITLLVLTIIPLTEGSDTVVSELSVSWMSQLSDEIPLNQIIVPGAHNSASHYVQFGFVTKCQSKSVYDQLSEGNRYLDVRVSANQNTSGLFLSHDFVLCRNSLALLNNTMYLNDYLRQCYQFLDEHPSETVLFVVKHEYGDISISDLQYRLNRYIEEDPDYWLLTDTIPTLGEARGKLVLFRRYSDDAGLGPESGISFRWSNQSGTEFQSEPAAETSFDNYTIFVQDWYEYDVNSKWLAFRIANESCILNPDPSAVVINFLSTKGTLSFGHPYYFSSKLNPMLSEYIQSGNAIKGWIVLDFIDSDLAYLIYSANF